MLPLERKYVFIMNFILYSLSVEYNRINRQCWHATPENVQILTSLLNDTVTKQNHLNLNTLSFVINIHLQIYTFGVKCLTSELTYINEDESAFLPLTLPACM